ncbi:MAG: hypothetical protein KDC38_01660 [Planctomycetes bacterium]|nr:hypothetical protein [Planctomycetota bacterium]
MADNDVPGGLAALDEWRTRFPDDLDGLRLRARLWELSGEGIAAALVRTEANTAVAAASWVDFDPPRSSSLLDQAFAIEPTNLVVRAVAIEHQLRGGDLDRAEDELASWEPDEIARTPCWFERIEVRVDLARERWDEAEARLRRDEEGDPDAAWVGRGRARLELSRGNVAAAEAALASAAFASRSDPETYELRVRVDLALERWDSAERIAVAAANRYPRLGAALLLPVDVALARSRIDEARARLEPLDDRPEIPPAEIGRRRAEIAWVDRDLPSLTHALELWASDGTRDPDLDLHRLFAAYLREDSDAFLSIWSELDVRRRRVAQPLRSVVQRAVEKREQSQTFNRVLMVVIGVATVGAIALAVTARVIARSPAPPA